MKRWIGILGIAAACLETAPNRAATAAELDVAEVIFAVRPFGLDGHYYANFGYSCIDPDYWIHGRDGGRLCKLNLQTGELTALLDDPAGAVRDPRVDYEGTHGSFLVSRKGDSHHYNLYEINTDGTGLRQITTGPWDDVEPTYLPDGDVMFCSTRCKRYIGCWLAPSAVLHRCDTAGKHTPHGLLGILHGEHPRRFCPTGVCSTRVGNTSTRAPETCKASGACAATDPPRPTFTRITSPGLRR